MDSHVKAFVWTDALCLFPGMRNNPYATFISLDVTNEQQWIRTVDATIEKYGQLDILVNNAGIFRMETVDETDLELWNRIQEVNATGVFLGIKHGAAAMRRSGGGSIVNISSGAGIVGSATGAAYHASKGAVRLLTKAAAIQPGFPIWAVFRLKGQPKRDSGIIFGSCKASQSPVYPIRDAILAVNHVSCPSLLSSGPREWGESALKTSRLPGALSLLARSWLYPPSAWRRR